jgi:hypothetical protein
MDFESACRADFAFAQPQRSDEEAMMMKANRRPNIFAMSIFYAQESNEALELNSVNSVELQ